MRDESSLIGQSLAKTDFRQRYNSVVLAVHRNGVNITSRIAELPLEIGDTLLVITARNNLEALEATRDFVMTDTPDEPTPDAVRHHRPLHVMLSWAALVGVVLTATITDFLHRSNPAIPAIPDPLCGDGRRAGAVVAAGDDAARGLREHRLAGAADALRLVGPGHGDAEHRNRGLAGARAGDVSRKTSCRTNTCRW